MQARPLKDDGCTVVDAPYKEEDLDASKLGVDTSFPVLRSPWLKVASDFVKAPVYSTFITPNSPWLVPMMFGDSPNITGGITGFDYGDGSAWVYGAFSTDSVHAGSSTGYTTNVARVSFQAQRASSIYGESSIVQPSALRALTCIKF